LEADFITSDDPTRIQQLSNQLVGVSQAAGQVLFEPPNVAGWPGGDDWVSTTALLSRYNFAAAAARDAYPAVSLDVSRLLRQRDLTSAEAIVDFFLDLMVDGDVTAAQRQTLLDYLVLNDNGSRAAFQLNEPTITKKVRGLLHLIATMPQYQLA
jgi:hypothetical protein